MEFETKIEKLSSSFEIKPILIQNTKSKLEEEEAIKKILNIFFRFKFKSIWNFN